MSTGRAAYVGVSNYTGWQTAQAATWQRAVPGPGAAGVAPRWSTPCSTAPSRHEVLPAGAGARPRRAALVAAGPRGADRQVPHRHARPTPAAPRRTSPPSSSAYLDDRAPRDRRGGGPRGRRPRLVPARGRAGLGARPARRHRADRRRPHRRPAAGRAGRRGRALPEEIVAGARRRLGRPDGEQPSTPARGRGVEWEFDKVHVLARVLAQRGHQAAGRAGRARRLGARPGPDRPRRHPPGACCAARSSARCGRA